MPGFTSRMLSSSLTVPTAFICREFRRVERNLYIALGGQIVYFGGFYPVQQSDKTASVGHIAVMQSYFFGPSSR